jgi:hypothetical protein
MLAIRFAAGFCLALAIAFAAGPAEALDKCKASVDRRDGTIYVDAGNVDGTLNWGYNEFEVTETFANNATCVSKGKAKKCTLGAEGTDLRIVPPPLCRVHLADSSDVCDAWVQGCVPGSRPICPPDMTWMGPWCIDSKAHGLSVPLDHSLAIRLCLELDRELCPTHVIMTCDSIDRSKTTPDSCGDLTDDNAVTLWTQGTHAESGENVYSHLNCYKGDNTLATGGSCGTGSTYPFFCCRPLGGL